MSTWSLRQRPSPSASAWLGVAGAIVLLLGWELLAYAVGNRALCPTPRDVLAAFPVLLRGGIHRHALYSLSLNLAAYVVSVAIAFPIGFVVGLFGPIRAMVERPIAGFRFLPITAFVGVVVAWFGISHSAKVAFLVGGVLVYLIPQVIQRIDEVEGVYVDTAKTCGATRWQRVRSVFWPLVVGRLSDDCRNLLAITWTYLIVAEGFNLSEGGLGAQIVARGRAWQLDYVFAIVAIIALIGLTADKLWIAADRRLLKWKHA